MLASVATQAFGFAPAPVAPVPVVRAAAPQMGVESELGATGPLGFWDPLGMVSTSLRLLLSPCIAIPTRAFVDCAAPHPRALPSRFAHAGVRPAREVWPLARGRDQTRPRRDDGHHG